MNSSIFFLLCLILTTALSCGRKKDVSDAYSSLDLEQKSDTVQEPLFNYWDNFKFDDSLSVQNPEVGEQALVNFIVQLNKLPDSIGAKAIKKMLQRVKTYPGSLSYFTKQYEHYLYDPNSPYRNDALYQPVLEYLVDSVTLSGAERYRYEEKLALVRKNKVGTEALDFSFQHVDGKISKLSDYDNSYILLFFYEPGCPNCDVSIEELKTSTGFRQLIEKGILNVLTIYPHGNHQEWLAYHSKIPSSWINGTDKQREIKTKRLYDLKASPTIYLLDSDKKVLLKDTDLNQVANYFNNTKSM